MCAEIMKTIIHAVRPVFTWDLLCLARLVVIAWPTLSSKEASPRRTKGMRSQCWIQFNVILMISSSVYMKNISVLGNKEQKSFPGFFSQFSYDLIQICSLDVCKNLQLAQRVSRLFPFFNVLYRCVNETVCKILCFGQTCSFSGFFFVFLMLSYRCVNGTVGKTLSLAQQFLGFFSSVFFMF